MEQNLKPVTSEPISTLSAKPAAQSVPSISWVVLAICWFVMFAEGYDLGIYGAVLPALMEFKEWSLTPAQAGTLGSYALMGMLLGAVVIGTITDLIGRKKVLIFCISLFSLMMFLASMAPSPELFGLYRFIAGIGCGGVIPTASALTIEYAPVKRRSMMYAIMYTGYCIGGVFGALLSMFFLEDHGWRLLIIFGAIPILVVPFIIKFLPESVSFLRAKKKFADAEKLVNKYNIPKDLLTEYKPEKGSEAKKTNAVATLFSKENIRATVFFWITFFMGLFMIYGLSTWLPKMMKAAGYPLGSSISFLLMLNLSAAIGALLAGAAADRWGSKKVIFVSYLLAGISIALLSVKPSSITAVYCLVGIAGFGTIGTTLILNAYISKYFSAENRGTAFGWALGFGRVGAIMGPILGGLLMTWKVDLSWNFYIFSIAAILASISVLFIPKNKNGII